MRPICQLVLAHELESGAAVRAELGAMSGPAADSEVAMARRLLPRIPANSLVRATPRFADSAIQFF